jgi:small subunit ribosomal protein S3
MGQKIHPVGFRLGITKTHQSQWFSSGPIYPRLILEDYFIRNTLFKQFTNGSISKIEIQRKFDDQIQLTLYSPKPSLILTYYKNDLKNLSTSLTKTIKKNRKSNFQNLFQKELNFKDLYSLNPKVTVQIFELSTPDANANFIADVLVDELQKRVAFRRAMKKTLRRAQRAKVQGIKIQISGRLNGAEIARSEWAREGQIPLQTLRAKIDYCYRTAKTIYGILGVKVWVFKK